MKYVMTFWQCYVRKKIYFIVIDFLKRFSHVSFFIIISHFNAMSDIDFYIQNSNKISKVNMEMIPLLDAHLNPLLKQHQPDYSYHH